MNAMSLAFYSLLIRLADCNVDGFTFLRHGICWKNSNINQCVNDTYDSKNELFKINIYSLMFL